MIPGFVEFKLWFNERSDWQPFRSFIQKPGQSIWLGNGCLTAKEIYPVNLLIHWEAGEKGPWRLATNLPDRVIALLSYVLTAESKLPGG